jgi:hypothetical protein
VGFELGPLLVSGRPVLVGRSLGASSVEEALVVADEIFVEGDNVAAGGLNAEVAEQSCADVDRKPVVDDLGREQVTRERVV